MITGSGESKEDIMRIYGAGRGPDDQILRQEPDAAESHDWQTERPFEDGELVAVLCYSPSCPICGPYADLGAVPYGSIDEPPYHNRCQCELVPASKGEGRIDPTSPTKTGPGGVILWPQDFTPAPKPGPNMR